MKYIPALLQSREDLSLYRACWKRPRRKEAHRKRPPGYTIQLKYVRSSTLVAAVVAGLTIGRISTSAWRATIATLHLVAAAVSTSTARNTPAVAGHLTVSLMRHARSPLSSVVPITATCRARSTHRRLLVRISRHGTSRVWSTLRRHGLRTAVLREAIGR